MKNTVNWQCLKVETAAYAIILSYSCMFPKQKSVNFLEI